MTIYFFVRNVAYQNKSLGFALYIVGMKYILYNRSCFTFLPGLHPSIDRLEAVRRNKFFPHIVFIVVLITVIKKNKLDQGAQTHGFGYAKQVLYQLSNIHILAVLFLAYHYIFKGTSHSDVMCPQLTSYCCDQTPEPNVTGEEKIYVAQTSTSFSSSSEEDREGSQGRYLEAGTELEDPEECCLLLCSLRIIHPPFLEHSGLPSYRWYCPLWSGPSRVNQKSRARTTSLSTGQAFLFFSTEIPFS